MDRRFFLKYIPYIGILFIEAKNAFNQLVSSVLASFGDQIGGIFLSIKPEGKSAINIPIFRRNRIDYISTKKLAAGLGYHTYFNDQKKKIVLYLPQNRIIITANNAFVIIDTDTFQMPGLAIWHDYEIYVPVDYFIPLINRQTTLRIDYDQEKRSINLTQPDVNITKVEISEKTNGTMIRFETTKKFRKGEVTADIRYGWLHVDFYGGKADNQQFARTIPSGLIKKVKMYQFSELISMAFLLKREPASIEIIPSPESNAVIVVLRTTEKMSDDEFSDFQEEESENNEPSEEIKKQLEEERKKWLIDVVVIDPGHGGKDPGAIGVARIREKDIVLQIAKKLGKMIEKELPGVKVIYTRQSDNFVPLKKRTQIANENNGKVFISIHANSNKKKSVSGFETYILGAEKGEQAREVVLKENSVISFEDDSMRSEYGGINQILATMAQNAFSRQSEYLGSLVQQELHKELRSIKIPNRGVKQGPFWVMVGASMPNILVEVGFLSSSYDSKILKTAVYQQKIAQGIFNGLKRFKTDYENAI